MIKDKLPEFNPKDGFSFSNTAEVIQSHLSFNFDVYINPFIVLNGNTEYTFISQIDNLSKIILDTKDLKITSVDLITNENSKIKLSYDIIENIEYVDLGNPLVIHLPNDISSKILKYDKMKISISSIADESIGDKNENWSNIKGKREFSYCYISCSHIAARTVIPCQDTPAAKFRFDSKITIEEPYIAYISGIEISQSTKIEDSNRRVYYHEQPIKISSYLLGLVFAVGTSVALSERIKVFCEESLIPKVKEHYKLLEVYLQEAEKLFGKYEWQEFNIILCPEYEYYGMEHPNLIFIWDECIHSQSLIIHEMTHFWFGNLVSNVNFENFWINEGINTFAEHLLIKKVLGIESYKMKVEGTINYLKQEIEKLGEENIQTALFPCMNHEDPLKHYNFVPYYKGSMFLRYIEKLIGEENMLKLLQNYVISFKFMCLDYKDFKEYIISEIKSYFDLSKASEILKEIDWDKWILSPGTPPISDLEEIKLLK